MTRALRFSSSAAVGLPAWFSRLRLVFGFAGARLELPSRLDPVSLVSAILVA
jgi:hypothetical protein